MRRKTVYRAIEGIDREQLEQFQAGMRKRYSDEHILDELRACAKRLGRSPTMREFEADPGTTVHPSNASLPPPMSFRTCSTCRRHWMSTESGGRPGRRRR